MKFDAYQMVTDRICELLEQGVAPWQKPWQTVLDCGWSGQTGNPYSLLNQMLLLDPQKKYKTMQEMTDDIRGEWLSFNQVKERGGSVKKGEHGRRIVFFKMLPVKDEDGIEDERKMFPFLSVTTVFHTRQCEGIEQKFHTDENERYEFTENRTAEDVAEGYLKRSGVKLTVSESDKAFYRPSTDEVFIPAPDQYKLSEEYYSTLFHELTHSTGHPSRLNRVNGNQFFGNESYSLEELVAEIGSASILATVGIGTKNSLNNSASYIGNWLKALKNDKTMIVKAAGRAEKAVKMILDIKEEE